MQVTFNQHFKLNGKLLLYQQTKQLKYAVSYIKWSKEIKNCIVKGICVERTKIIWDLHHKHRQNKHPRGKASKPKWSSFINTKGECLKEKRA